MKTAVVLCSLLAVAIASDVEWESFKSKFGRRYKSPTEEAFRKKIFLNNKMHVDQQNQRHAEGKATFTMAINQFADLTTKEFSERFNGYKMAERSEENVKDLPSSTADEVDWTTSGCVTGIRIEGQCDSSWAICACESIEFYTCQAGLGLTSCSVQNLIDCSYSYGNLGCNGGMVDSGFQYVIDNGGINSEADYPYSGTSQIGHCKFNPAYSFASLSGYTDVLSGNENQLRNAVDQGVVCSAIDASHLSFQLYSGGVYNEPLCTTQGNHWVLIAGYGTAVASGDYWLVKNSWGPSWGISGYIWMSRNNGNQCGIANLASYPHV